MTVHYSYERACLDDGGGESRFGLNLGLELMITED